MNILKKYLSVGERCMSHLSDASHSVGKVAMMLLLVASVLYPFSASASATGQQELAKVASKLNNLRRTSGVKAVFRVSGAFSSSGTLYCSGNKFAVIANTSSSWYNGKTLWTYNPSVNETTVVTPTASELMESNPLEYINSYTQFNVSKIRKSSDSTTFTLVPKSKKMGVKSLILSVNPKTLYPQKIVIYPSSGGQFTLAITSFTVGHKFADSVFKYPAAKYPRATLVDLR